MRNLPATTFLAGWLILPASAEIRPPAPDTYRFATFNVALNRAEPLALHAQLKTGTLAQARAIAEIIQRVRPDVLLLNEFDHDPDGAALARFQQNFLGRAHNGQAPIHYPYTYAGASNTGLPSNFDLNNDGQVAGPADAQGFGTFHGQYGMALLSMHPIDLTTVRTFQTFLWRDMPHALLPPDWFTTDELAAVRLSSKSHWDIPVQLPGATVRVLAAHPTPPVFDGAEDRNGRRNHDEIRFWADYVGTAKHGQYIYDDAGRRGGLGNARFVIVGDYNADPLDGDSVAGAIDQLLTHPRITAQAPRSAGAQADAVAAGGSNATQQGPAATDTANFNPAGPGNLRVDYVLPSRDGLRLRGSGVFWPAPGDSTRALIGSGHPIVSSDHRLVWVDVSINTQHDTQSSSR